MSKAHQPIKQIHNGQVTPKIIFWDFYIKALMIISTFDFMVVFVVRPISISSDV